MTTLLTTDEPILISYFFPHLMNLASPPPWIMQFHSDAKCHQMAGGLLIQGKMELVILVAFSRLFLISLIPLQSFNLLGAFTSGASGVAFPLA
jgi:hypothetical protein